MPYHYTPLFTRDLSQGELIEEYFRQGLRRRKQPDNLQKVIDTICQELNGSGNCIGYRQMHQRLRVNHGLVVDRETVRLSLKILDPVGVENRSRRRLRRREYRGRGPNFIWHMDGYDKLKPYGMAIHGAIDGYSRRLLWLEVGTTNNDPSVTARYFLDYVKQVGGVPRIARTDAGTENVTICGIQRFFRANCTDSFNGEKSFMYGASVSNQRIEAWWSQLRQSQSDWWIEFLRGIREEGLYDDSNFMHVQCMIYCFIPILREELYNVMKLWNTHRIRPSSNRESPPGRPDVLYSVPELNSTEDYLVPVSPIDITAAEAFISHDNTDDADENFTELAKIIEQEQNLQKPTNATEAKYHYVTLLDYINQI
ncbi:uncharacterized protein LOC110240064 [Exaiptasia diaphana]|uniref:Integrase core domain-containing protein n=1 Tax=Exaiptasia diaphana TaxID=2652724 RepID=A0A913XAK4_EXADI|nr:uncharacterized protein LOC110240064 [Exaiptasia diaphana]